MPTNSKYDFLLGGRGYMLARPDQKTGARAWQRSGTPDTPAVEQPRIASEFGGLPGQIDYPEVWNDWSGGFGYAYRHPKDENSYFGFLANPNTYHWSENFDARFARQLVHSQKLTPVGGNNTCAEAFLSIPGVSQNTPSPPGFNMVLIVENAGPNLVGSAQIEAWIPNDAGTPVNPIPVVFGYNRFLGYKPAIYGSYIYMPSLSGTVFVQIPFGRLNTIGTDGPFNAQGFAVAGNRLWAALGAQPRRPIYLTSTSQVDATLAMTTGNWSATISVGNGYQPILDMVELEDQLYCGLPNGLYVGDQSGTFVNVLPQLNDQISLENCRDLTVFNGEVIAQHIGGLYSYLPSTTVAKATEIGPQAKSNRSQVHGYFRCTKGFGQWLYAGLYTGSVSYLLAGLDDRANSNSFIWHTLQRLPHTSKVHRIFFDGITSSSSGTKVPARMWLATDASIDTGGTAPVYWSSIPFLNDNPLAPQINFTANYTNSARMDLGSTDGRTPATPKIYRQLEVWADNLDGSQRWGLLYYTIDSGNRTLLGTINQSPKSVLYFPNAESSFAMGQSIELSLESYITAGAETTTPVYRSIVLRQTQVPRSVDIIQATVDLGDNMMDRQGARMRPGNVQVNELRGLVATGPVNLTDILGNSWWAKVLAPVEEQEQWQDGIANPSVLANIKLAIMNFTGP